MSIVNKFILKKWQFSIDCLVLNESIDWILVNNLFDYSVDGYALIQKKIIKERIYSEREKFVEKVLLANNKVNYITPFPFQLITNELFTYFKRTETIIQISFKDESYVYVGKITKLLSHSFYLQTIDTKGIWDKTENLIRFNSVYKIDFDTDYIKSLITYMKSTHSPTTGA
jgi:hypothetical protein